MVNSQSDAISSPNSSQLNNDVAIAPLSSNRQKQQDSWTVAQSEKLYNIKGWGEPYFAISQQGNIIITLPGKNQPIELLEIVDSLTQQGTNLPCLIRLPEIMAESIGKTARLYELGDRSLRLFRSLSGSFPN